MSQFLSKMGFSCYSSMAQALMGLNYSPPHPNPLEPLQIYGFQLNLNAGYKIASVTSKKTNKQTNKNPYNLGL